MLALDYDTAKQAAIGLIVVFVVLSVVSAIIIKNIIAKVISTLLLLGLALGMWTQRQNLQDCKSIVMAKIEVGDTSTTTCRFFGQDVDLPDPRTD